MAKVVRFGDFEVDLPAGQLYKRGTRVGLREKSFQVLAFLLEHPGEVVTREHLQQRLWPADVFVDFDNNLNTAVARLREALGDSAKHPRFIDTLPKRGYRFIASVSEGDRAPGPTPVTAATVVVLPFLNLSGDPGQEYFSDAMTDEIITELAALTPDILRVIARTTAMRYKGGRKDVAQIARELGVDYLVEGGVRREEDRIDLNVQLVRAGSQVQVFAKRYHGDMNDIFSVQSSVAREIAEHIDIGTVAEAVRATMGVGGPARRTPTRDLAAYDEYLQGRFHMARVNPEGLGRHDSISRKLRRGIRTLPSRTIPWQRLTGTWGTSVSCHPETPFRPASCARCEHWKSTTRWAKPMRCSLCTTSSSITTGRRSTGKWRARLN